MIKQNKIASGGLLAAGLGLLLTGCGGSGNSNFSTGSAPASLTSGVSTVGSTASGASSVTRKTGQVSLTIQWPAQKTDGTSRYVPTYAQRLRFILQNTADANRRYVLVVPRPTDVSQPQTVTFADPILTGAYHLTGEAHVALNASDASIATAAQDIQVNAEQTTNARLTLQAQLKEVQFLGDALQAAVGQPTAFQARGVTQDGQTVFVPTGASGVRFSIVAGGDTTQATITPDGILTANHAGTVRVRITESDLGLTAEADVAVTGDTPGGPSNGGLLPGTFAKLNGDSRNSGAASGPGAPAGGQIAWKYSDGANLNYGRERAFVAVAADGTGYVTGNKAVYAVKPDGSLLWKHDLQYNPTCAPALSADGTLYVASGPVLYALDAATGTEKFNKILDVQGQGGLNIGPDGTVYLAGLAQDPFGGGVVAVDGVTGTVKWTHTETETILACPALSPDGTQIIETTFYGGVFALDAQSGAKKWDYRSDTSVGVPGAAIVGPDGTVFYGDGGQFDNSTGLAPASVYALDGASGTLKWKHGFPNGFGSAPPVVSADGKSLYVSCPGQGRVEAGVYALSTLDGSVLWQNARVGVGGVGGPWLALGASGALYVSGAYDSKNGLTALDGSTGSLLWTAEVTNTGAPSPVSLAPNGQIYFTVFDGSASSIIAVK